MRYFPLYIILTVLGLQACSSAGGDKRGHEFMPDMVHSTAVEANLYNYYYYNTWGDEEDYKKTVSPRKPVNGTVARGMSSVSYQKDEGSRYAMMAGFDGTSNQTQIAMTPNGAAPYYYDDNDDERIRASQEIVGNPFPITENGLERGKELYEVYCGVCHGEKADGGGYLVRDPNPATGDLGGVYPAAPANFLLPQFVDTTNGLYYHAIMYGKNVMGGYADKLSYEERWQVIHYIRALQAKERKLKYDPYENTLNAIDKPWSLVSADVEQALVKRDGEVHFGSSSAYDRVEDAKDAHHNEDGHGEDGLGHGHGEDGHDHEDGGHH